jgi:hypothetical protein
LGWRIVFLDIFDYDQPTNHGTVEPRASITRTILVPPCHRNVNSRGRRKGNQ